MGRNSASQTAKVEQERTARQEGSEQHIDDLFNGKEIGHADINTLEEDFGKPKLGSN